MLYSGIVDGYCLYHIPHVDFKQILFINGRVVFLYPRETANQRPKEKED